LISLRKTANELDRLMELQEAASECYSLALRSMSQYAIEADPADLAEFREHLKTMGELWREAESTEAFRSVQASFRGELREYRDKVHERIARLRAEVEAGAKAMATFAAGITSTGADHEGQMKRELSRLETASRSDNLEEMRHSIRMAVAGITAGVDQLRREHQMMMAQWQDEIRMLHQEFQAERRALFIDKESGAWNKPKLDGKLEEVLRQDQPFCALLLVVRNLNRLERRHSRSAVEGALNALVRRFQGVISAEAFIGRYSREEFVAILDVAPAGAMALSRDVTKKLSGNYSIQEGGIAHDVAVEVIAGVVERGQSGDTEAFLKKLDQMSRALNQG